MKSFTIITVMLVFFSLAVKAQKKAELDNGARITVTKTDKATGRNHEMHYVMTNVSSEAMDFSLYIQLNTGSWDVTHHLNLQPGGTYEFVSGFTGVSGKYVVFSAPHSDWASFPSFMDVDKALAASSPPPQPSTTETPSENAQPTTPAQTTTSKTPAKAPKQPSTPANSVPANSPSSNNDAPPVPPPM